MKLKLFGKEIFDFQVNRADQMSVPSIASVLTMTHLPDFRNMGHGGEWSGNSVSLSSWTLDDAVMVAPDGKPAQAKAKAASKPKERTTLSPKRVYEMKMLHDKVFSLNMDPKYVDQQIADFKEKLAMMKDPNYDYRGSSEIGSIILRMENRKKYDTVRDVFEQFPYTTNKRIDSVLKNHDYLQLGEVSQFLADMPQEATAAMKKYNTATQKLCEKKAVFYIIANKKDFQKTSSRRDPILLAQSPFGHFWQIIGAWDDEMLFLDEL